MLRKRNKPVKRNSENLSLELTISEHLNAEKMLFKKLKKRKKEYNEFLTQIDNFIKYAQDNAKNIDDDKLRLKYKDAVKEEESLRDKIMEYLKKNDELIESVKKSNLNGEL